MVRGKPSIAIFTQDERVYLPIPLARVVEALGERVSCVILAPAMSTHGGVLKGLIRHLGVFGVRGTLVMGSRVVAARLFPRLRVPPGDRRFWSIAEVARRHRVPVYGVGSINSAEAHAILDRHPADLLVSISCPQIVRKKILDRFPAGGINVHSAPLPKYRGLMPSFWILYHGETESAVTVHVMAEKLDNGEILLQRTFAVAPDETWDSLIRKSKREAAEALLEAIARIDEGRSERRPNPDAEATYFSFPTWRHAREFRARGRRMF